MRRIPAYRLSENPAECSPAKGSVPTRRWVALAIGLVSLAAFAFFAPAAMRALEGDLARVIEARGLEPDGLFYTETDEVAEAFNYLTNSRLGEAPTPQSAGVAPASGAFSSSSASRPGSGGAWSDLSRPRTGR